MRIVLRIIIAFLAAFSSAVAAQDEPASSVDEAILEAQQSKARSEASKARYDALKAEIEAKAALAEARFGFLPSSGAEGKVTLGEGAGSSEVAMLTALALDEAARRIVLAAEPPKGTLLIAGGENFDFDSLTTFRAETEGVETVMKVALMEAELAGCTEPETGPELAVGTVGAAVSALAGMLRTDTELRGVKTDLASQILVRAVAGKQPGLVIPSYRLVPSPAANNPVVCTLDRLEKAQTRANAKLHTTPPPSGDEKTLLEAAIKRYEAFIDGWTKPASDGSVRLAEAIEQAELVSEGTQVLRVYLDNQGGSLLTRRNLWTALGAKAVAVSGGVVASFTLYDPYKGKVTTSGMFVCGTTLTDFRKVQTLEGIGARCLPETVERRREPETSNQN
ncbi:hypothetical protein K3175_05875 [Qipengyuania sp. GH1]|uniref:hypothetical protein n=1 Tax=Qipengyuania aestuarii TaxID=2867241 RepID=UPI001C8896E8|nr:hypothetical protein [Qipengyuania aestuarii]MBX7535182.1 hypothetical protein [Qipengyuania aestuarii]